MDLTQQVAVFEMGMNHLGEIRRLCEIALPHIGVITNIGFAHVGYLGSIERIQQAKGELIEALDASSVAIVNADDPRALALGHQAPGRLLTFGQDRRPTYVDGARRPWSGGGGVHPVLNNTACEVTLPVLGVHQLMNALAAAAVGVAMHVPAADIVTGYRAIAACMGGWSCAVRGRDPD